MKKGYLSNYFKGVAIKELSEVEVNANKSNQHEFNGVKQLQVILGTNRQKFPAKFIYLTDSDELPIPEEGYLTWYDARENHQTRTEFRLYFSTNTALNLANASDLLVIGVQPNNELLVLVVEAGTTINSQVLWLFGKTENQLPKFSVREDLETEQDRLGFASRFILESIGIDVEDTEESYLESMLFQFGKNLPSTRIFSEYTRSTIPDIFSGTPDEYIIACMQREETLFRTFEKHQVGEQLQKGFDGDVIPPKNKGIHK